MVALDIRERRVGYFLGDKWGLGKLGIISSPSLGTGTYTRGLVMLDVVTQEERVDIYKALAQWLLVHHAMLFHVDDWCLRVDSLVYIPPTSVSFPLLDERNIAYSIRPTLFVNLKQSIDDLWNGCSYKSCKYCVNKARKNGLYVREIDDKNEIANFTAIHYKHLQDVCLHKGTKPKLSQSRSRMQALCEELFPDRVLMLEVLGPNEVGEEIILASSIFCVDKGQTSYWTGASYRHLQKFCPNELMVWEAMRILHERGAGDLNFCGMASYKRKFGTVYAYVPQMAFAKYRFLLKISNIKQVYSWFRQLAGRIRLRK